MCLGGRGGAEICELRKFLKHHPHYRSRQEVSHHDLGEKIEGQRARKERRVVTDLWENKATKCYSWAPSQKQGLLESSL